jgi:hypothetical protein
MPSFGKLFTQAGSQRGHCEGYSYKIEKLNASTADGFRIAPERVVSEDENRPDHGPSPMSFSARARLFGLEVEWSSRFRLSFQHDPSENRFPFRIMLQP